MLFNQIPQIRLFSGFILKFFFFVFGCFALFILDILLNKFIRKFINCIFSLLLVFKFILLVNQISQISFIIWKFVRFNRFIFFRHCFLFVALILKFGSKILLVFSRFLGFGVFNQLLQILFIFWLFSFNQVF